MQIVIDIPDEQIKKSLEESKYINEDEGTKGSVHIVMLYTNAQLEFVDVEKKTNFYSCEYKILPKEHGRLIDADELISLMDIVEEENKEDKELHSLNVFAKKLLNDAPTIIETDEVKK